MPKPRGSGSVVNHMKVLCSDARRTLTPARFVPTSEVFWGRSRGREPGVTTLLAPRRLALGCERRANSAPWPNVGAATFVHLAGVPMGTNFPVPQQSPGLPRRVQLIDRSVVLVKSNGDNPREETRS